MISEIQDQRLYLKQLVERLQKSTIDGSAITMCLLPNKNINQYRNLLANQISHAANIKDKSNKLTVIEGLKSARETIRQYKKVPANGLIVIVAKVMTQNNHSYQKVVEVLEPSKPITKQVYSCGKNFAFNHIHEQILVNDALIGFIVVDGVSTLFATLKGNHKTILKQLKSDIMRNHNKGGQSSVRFSRLRDQSRYNYIKNSCQQANRLFSSLEEKVSGFIIAGSANMKMDFIQNQLLSPFISKKIIKVIDVAQGSEQGLKQAIIQSKDILLDQALIRQRRILQEYYLVMNKQSQKITNGLRSVQQVIMLGICKQVICVEESFSKEQVQQIRQLCDQNGCELVKISNKSEEANLFVKSYGGIGAILRYEFDSAYLKQSYMEEQTGLSQKDSFFL